MSSTLADLSLPATGTTEDSFSVDPVFSNLLAEVFRVMFLELPGKLNRPCVNFADIRTDCRAVALSDTASTTFSNAVFVLAPLPLPVSPFLSTFRTEEFDFKRRFAFESAARKRW